MRKVCAGPQCADGERILEKFVGVKHLPKEGGYARIAAFRFGRFQRCPITHFGGQNEAVVLVSHLSHWLALIIDTMASNLYETLELDYDATPEQSESVTTGDIKDTEQVGART